MAFFSIIRTSLSYFIPYYFGTELLYEINAVGRYNFSFLNRALKKVNNALKFGISGTEYNGFDNILWALLIISVINLILRVFFSLFFIGLKLGAGIISLFAGITGWFNKILG